MRHRRKVPSQQELRGLYGPPVRWHNRLFRRLQRRCALLSGQQCSTVDMPMCSAARAFCRNSATENRCGCRTDSACAAPASLGSVYDPGCQGYVNDAACVKYNPCSLSQCALT